MNPKVKFCGLSHLPDAHAMNKIAPDYAGFVFWPKSKRLVDADQARALRDALDPKIRSVGVFVDADVHEVADLLNDGVISVAQLHGNEDESYIAKLRELANPPIEIWKAFEVKDDEDIEAANASTADLVLLDGGKGEGRAFLWELLDGMKRSYALAGGLNPDNVADALEMCSPAVLDVSSGIEMAEEQSKDDVGLMQAPHKSYEAMCEFIGQVRTRCAKGRCR